MMGLGHQAEMIKTLIQSQIPCLTTYETLEEVMAALQPHFLSLSDEEKTSLKYTNRFLSFLVLHLLLSWYQEDCCDPYHDLIINRVLKQNAGLHCFSEPKVLLVIRCFIILHVTITGMIIPTRSKQTIHCKIHPEYLIGKMQCVNIFL